MKMIVNGKMFCIAELHLRALRMIGDEVLKSPDMIALLK
jgi:hypothetical protein